MADATTEGRCATCEHWRFDRPDWEFDELHLGECKAIKQRETIQSEALAAAGVENWDDGSEEVKRAAMMITKAIAVDGSGYYAALRTAPDFGCTLWTVAAPKEASDAS